MTSLITWTTEKMKEPLTKIEQEKILVEDKDGKFSLGLEI